MKRKYYIPYLCVTLPLVGIMTAMGCYLHANYLYEQEKLNLRNH